MEAEYEPIIECFLKYSLTQIEQISEGYQRLVLPSFPSEMVLKIIHSVHSLFQAEPVMLALRSPIVVVGDLHGHLMDLLRIIQIQGTPAADNRYVFLGDLVDRGEFSLETVLLIFLMKLKYPDFVHVIRGNHEFSQMCHQCGFFAEVIECFPGTDIFSEFMKCFSMMPLSCTIDDRIICMHGGIGPNVFTLLQFSSIQRPVCDFSCEFVASILWSDPGEDVVQFQPSLRGTGYLFGAAPLEDFLEATKKTVLIRAHECVQTGIQKMLHGRCYTVFSASNYCGLSRNEAGTLRIMKGQVAETKTYEPLTYLKRRQALFITLTTTEKKIPRILAAHSVNDFDKKKVIQKRVISSQSNRSLLPNISSSDEQAKGGTGLKKGASTKQKGTKRYKEIFKSNSQKQFQMLPKIKASSISVLRNKNDSILSIPE